MVLHDMSIPSSAAALLAIIAAPAAMHSDTPRAPAPASLDGVRLAQVRIQQHIVIRVPRVAVTARTMAAPPPPPPPVVEWDEKHMGKCVALDQLAGYAVTHDDSVDLMMMGSERLRVKLDSDCPALDFYSGFYIPRAPDGQLCAKRDAIHSRSGGECRVKSLKRLVPHR